MYLTSKCHIPFAPFVGVNHHRQSILLGYGLVSSEDIDKFLWLFELWLSFMSGRALNAIIAEQCKKAIEIVFPTTGNV